MIGILFKGEITKPAHAYSSVETVCVAEQVFVTNGNGIDQLWVYTHSYGNRPLLCKHL